ncbi:MAG: hypothetical protein VW894_01465, partial [Gammaproteobacteria bacterium]
IIFIVYFPIGIWAIFDSVLISENFLSTSFANVVGLEIISDLGKSEIAGLYGGINLVLGIIAFLAFFYDSLKLFIIKVMVLITSSIALGRFISSFLPEMPTFMNNYFLFEIVVAIWGVYLIRSLNKSA